MSELILKEDALNCFHDWIDRYGYEHTADEDPVYQMIAELKSIEDCDDAISRRMAIEVIDEWFKKVVRRNMSAYEYDSAYAQGEIDAYVTAINTLKTLPAVQPDHNADIGKKVEGDCISRQMALDAVSEYATIWMSYTDDMSASDIAQEAINSAKDTMIRILKEQPTVQPDHNADVSKKVDGNDCISRRAVKEKLKQNLTYMRAFGVDRCLELIDEISAVETEPKWISCKEKMPEEDLWTGASQQYSYGVLMYVLDDDGEEMIDFGHTIDGKWYSDTADTYVENSSNWKVIAWMLPPSYKENE